MRDSITLGFTSGLIGNMVKSIFNLLSWKSKKHEMLYSHLASSVFFKPRRTKKKGPLFVGGLVDITTGAILGVPLVYIMKRTGKDNYILKGVGYGALVWGLLFGAGHNLDLFLLKPKKARSNILSFFDHILFGVVTAHAAVKLADSGTFPDDEYDF